MRVVWFWADSWQEWISSMWRVQFPHAGLLKAGYESKIASAFELGDNDWHPLEDWADVIVIERLLLPPWAKHIHRWKAQGKRVFTTFDDAYWLMPDYMTHAKPTWNKDNLPVFGRLLSEIDGAIVPSIGLKKSLARHKNVHFIPNYPDLSFPAYNYAMEAPIIRDDDRYVIGWGGSHYHSIEILLPVFKKLIKIEPRVQIWIVGNSAAFNLLTEIPIEHKRFFPARPYGPYLAAIKQFDVFAIPISGQYDRCRSWIKPLEAALMGVPWVATDHSIYRDCLGGTLAKKDKEWVDALLSPPLAAKEWALGQDIAQHIEEYVEVFNV